MDEPEKLTGGGVAVASAFLCFDSLLQLDQEAAIRLQEQIHKTDPLISKRLWRFMRKIDLLLNRVAPNLYDICDRMSSWIYKRAERFTTNTQVSMLRVHLTGGHLQSAVESTP